MVGAELRQARGGFSRAPVSGKGAGVEELADHILLIAGLAAAGLALFAWAGDRRRMRRDDPDRVGIMPWTSLFFWALMAAVLLLGGAVQQVVGR